MDSINPDSASWSIAVPRRDNQSSMSTTTYWVDVP
jgi:hypothetical protein